MQCEIHSTLGFFFNPVAVLRLFQLHCPHVYTQLINNRTIEQTCGFAVNNKQMIYSPIIHEFRQGHKCFVLVGFYIGELSLIL